MYIAEKNNKPKNEVLMKKKKVDMNFNKKSDLATP